MLKDIKSQGSSSVEKLPMTLQVDTYISDEPQMSCFCEYHHDIDQVTQAVLLLSGLLLKLVTEKLEIRNVEMRKWPGANEGFTDCVRPCWLEKAQSECSEPEWEPWQVVDAVAWLPGDTTAY